MRIRLPFAGVFFLLCLLAGYAGLSSLQVSAVVNDKVLHLVTFFLLTVVFYWIVDTNRRRTLNLTIVVCTLGLGIGSEFLQGFLPNGREFDLYDIVANVVGSLAGLGLCSWYHLRMLERKRQRRQYNAVPGEDETDLELGEGLGHQEEGVTTSTTAGGRGTTLEEEVDNWDENAVDNWDDDDGAEVEVGGTSRDNNKGQEAEQNGGGVEDTKKRVD
ncbi:VanZ domain protein [Xylariomycetidae sp. FL2044]|nr:VanZ domain protein [Xylariomycetidae sp. FL2044]